MPGLVSWLLRTVFMSTYKQIVGFLFFKVPWPNGKALLSGGKDWEFESPWYRTASLFFALLRPLALLLYRESIDLIIHYQEGIFPLKDSPRACFLLSYISSYTGHYSKQLYPLPLS